MSCLCLPSLDIPETICHILTECRGTIEPRTKIWPELLNVVSQQFPENSILRKTPSNTIATQFILDCTSLNLPNEYILDRDIRCFSSFTTILLCSALRKITT